MLRSADDFSGLAVTGILAASSTKDFFEFALTSLLCTMCLAAGWFYLTRSRMVDTLATLETPRRTALRRRIRRTGAVCMMCVAVAFFYLVYELNRRESPQRVVLAGAAVGVLLLSMLLLAACDVYLTYRTRKAHRKPPA
jgi:ABC-type Fe3+-siderophore transport system permease subunit